MNTFLAAALVAGAALTLPSPTSLAQLAGPGAGHRTVPVAAAPAPAPAPRQVDKEKNEPHPEIRRAIRALENAKRDLNKAASDYGGHKVEAIKAIDSALEHLRLALKDDKK